MSRDTNTTYYEVKGTLVRETEKAFLFKPMEISGTPLEEDRAAMWFPFSQVSKFGFTGKNQGDDWFLGSEWILQQKDLL